MTPPPSWLRDPRVIRTVIVLAVLLVFGRTVTHDFAGGWDDGPLIVDNALVNPPTAEGFAQIWRRPHARMYIPAVYTTWWALARVATVPGGAPGATSSLNPYAFHAANVALHAAAALLVLAILRIVIRHDWPAGAGALLFAIHPLQVEPVAWATGMKDLLSGFFALLALWQYLKFRIAAEKTARRRTLYFIATVAFVLALLAKPSAVVVPLMAVILQAVVLPSPSRREFTPLMPWLALSLVWMVLTATVQPTPEIAPLSVPLRPLLAVNVLGFYLFKLIWPANLGIDYGMRPDLMALDARWTFVALAAAAAVNWSRRRMFGAALILFVAGILPVSGLTPFVFQWLSTVADRYVYLSMLGPALASAYVMSVLRRPRAGIVCGVLLAVLGVRAAAQAATWRDSYTLMRHALSVNPDSPVAHNQIGDHLFRDGDFEGARRHFQSAVDVKEDFIAARENLSSALLRLGRYREAERVIGRTIQIKRDLPEPLRRPTEEDQEKLEFARRRLAETAATTTTAPATRPSGE